jgi:predicted alpha/beta-hydrolase family hydrolase
VKVFAVETPVGPARVHLRETARARAALVLGHGAGGGVQAGDLVVAADAARAEGLSVALVEQPYRVAGRRSPPPPSRLDAAWVDVVQRLHERELRTMRLVVGGRSSGARVACRTADSTGATGVLCLAFPLQPPGGRPSRLDELENVHVPVLVVQGSRDPFGIPPAGERRTVIEVAGDHSLRSDVPAVGEAVGEWLARLLDQ